MTINYEWEYSCNIFCGFEYFVDFTAWLFYGDGHCARKFSEVFLVFFLQTFD